MGFNVKWNLIESFLYGTWAILGIVVVVGLSITVLGFTAESLNRSNIWFVFLWACLLMGVWFIPALLAGELGSWLDKRKK